MSCCRFIREEVTGLSAVGIQSLRRFSLVIIIRLYDIWNVQYIPLIRQAWASQSQEYEAITVRLK